MPPPGGPPDQTPPYVVATMPADDSTNVALDTRVEITFSENMDHRSVEGAVFVSPQPAHAPELHWQGKMLEVRLPGGLLADRTYVVTVGQASADEWNNRMAASYSFGFATGPALNRGEIVGRVLPSAGYSGQVYAWAYDLQVVPQPDPAHDLASYVTQPDAAGHFSFPRLGPGPYRVFAFQDQNGDRAYTPGRDALAVPPTDASVAEGADHLQLGDLQLAVRDSIPPKLAAVRTLDRAHVLLRFDEPVRVLAPPAIAGLGVQAVYQDPTDSSRVGVLTAVQAGGKTYQVHVEVADRAGNRAVVETPVRGDASEDRRAPEVLAVFPKPGASVPDTASISMAFSDAMRADPVANFWVASDSTLAPAGTFVWTAANVLVFVPAAPWPSAEPVRLRGRLEQLLDVSGNATKGSVVFSFTGLAESDLGDIRGRIVPAPSPMVVAAQALDGAARRYATRVAPGDSTFAIHGVAPGTYRLSGFLDSDGDGHWSAGTAVPFSTAEPLVTGADTLEVRARWEAVSERPLQAPAWRHLKVSEEETKP